MIHQKNSFCRIITLVKIEFLVVGVVRYIDFSPLPWEPYDVNLPVKFTSSFHGDNAECDNKNTCMIRVRHKF